MAWIDRPSDVYTMFKPERPLIGIPPTHNTHQDPLRTPEDVPSRAPWISANIEDLYNLTPFEVDQNRFPDVEDANWAMGMVSPPSPSRRSSLEVLPDVNTAVDLPLEWERGVASPSRRSSLELPLNDYSDTIPDLYGPPMLDPPSPSMGTLTGLPNSEAEWAPCDVDYECPQLSPPSPLHRGNTLPLLEFEGHSLFVEEAPLQPPAILLSAAYSPLHAEHCAILSLRDRTMYSERMSRARNKALRGRERELGRTIAALRATSDPAPDTAPTLHMYRTAATCLMVERTEEKRRRKKDKERLKELRVILGSGVDALLASDPTTDLGIAEGGSLGLALHTPPDADARVRALAERTHIMRRLTACMTMRRRDLGMRSLIEAGNMGAEVGEMPVRIPLGRSGLARSVSLPDPGGEAHMEKGHL